MSFSFKSQDYDMGFFDLYGSSPSPPLPAPVVSKPFSQETAAKAQRDLYKSRDDYDFLGCMSDNDENDEHGPLPGCSPYPFTLRMNGTTDSNTDRTGSSAVSTVTAGRTTTITTNSSTEDGVSKWRELQLHEEHHSPLGSPQTLAASRDTDNSNAIKVGTPEGSAPPSPVPTTAVSKARKKSCEIKLGTPQTTTTAANQEDNSNTNTVVKLNTPEGSSPSAPYLPLINTSSAAESNKPAMPGSPKRQVLPSVWQGRGAPAPKTVDAAASSPKTVRQTSTHYKKVFASNPAPQSGARYKTRRTVRGQEKRYNDEISLSSIPLPLERNNDSSLFIQRK